MSSSTESRYQALFEPVKLGPVTAPNSFYQVPHCTGMGHVLPRTLAAMRGMKAEGGWGVVCTEYCSIHPSSDDLPYPFAALWDDGDVANLAAMAQRSPTAARVSSRSSRNSRARFSSEPPYSSERSFRVRDRNSAIR